MSEDLKLIAKRETARVSQRAVQAASMVGIARRNGQPTVRFFDLDFEYEWRFSAMIMNFCRRDRFKPASRSQAGFSYTFHAAIEKHLSLKYESSLNHMSVLPVCSKLGVHVWQQAYVENGDLVIARALQVIGRGFVDRFVDMSE